MSVRRRSALTCSLLLVLALVAGALVLFAARPAVAGGTFAVTLLVVDGDGKPVAGAEAATLWNAREGPLVPYHAAVTGLDGKAQLVVDDWGERRPVLVLSADRLSGCVVGASRADDGKIVRAVLTPTTRVGGSAYCSELASKPANTIALVGADGFRLGACFIQSITKDARFGFRLPLGKYQLDLSASDTERKKQLLDVTNPGPEIDLGVVDLPAAKLAKLRGQTPPSLTVTEARGVEKRVQLADYKGKWVALEFWGWWCGPCVAGGIPEAIAFQKMYGEHADKFVILALHGSGAKTLAEMDSKLPAIRERYWNGEELPFPVIVDAGETTAKRFGIQGWPTTLIFDPDGKLVGERGFAELAARLPPVPAAKAWDACRDRCDNMIYGNDPKSPAAFQNLAKWLQDETYHPVELDVAAFRAAGVDPDKPIPTVVVGGLHTWRSRVELFLEPHGLGVTPSADGGKLVITKCPPIGGLPSVSQRAFGRDLDARLDRNPLAALVQKVRAVEFVDATLIEVARRLSREYRLTFAFNNEVDTTTKVSGKLGPAYLRDGLSQLLDPLGLTFAVRSEAIVISPKPR